ncbi:unnamed protein product [Symbiodinium sp. CCMP2592]|nr:unnamed protein product [Symbiodinium sp. CCMP2592]
MRPWTATPGRTMTATPSRFLFLWTGSASSRRKRSVYISERDHSSFSLKALVAATCASHATRPTAR